MDKRLEKKEVEASVCHTGEVLETLRRIARAADLHSRHLMRCYGLTAPQVVVLNHVERLGDACTASGLARGASLSQGTITSILTQLEQRGYLRRRRREDDRRRVSVELTAKGRACVGSAPPPLQEHFIAALGQLQDWEQTLLVSSLQRVAGMMEGPTPAGVEVAETAQPALVL